MSNTLLTISDITREAVAVLHEKLALAKNAVRKYEDRFGKKGGQIGTKVSIRKPPKYAVGTTADITSISGDSAEDYVDLNCTTRRNVKLVFSSQDLSLSIGDFRKQFLLPAISRLAREIDKVGFDLVKLSPQYRYGRTVTSAISFSDYVQMNALLTTQLAPEDGRTLYAGAIDHAGVVDANKGLFQNSTQIAEQYANGYMGTSGGFDWVSTENTPSIIWASVQPTAGTLSATGVEVASTLAVTGMGANAVVKAGTAFTVAATNAIDPETQDALNYLYTFIAASDVTLNGSGAGNITIASKMYTVATSGRTLANISALPQSGAAITPVELGTVASKAGKLVFGIQKDALALGVIGLEVPGGVDMAAQEDFEGIALRIVRSYDVLTDNWTCRIDTQFGWAVLRSELIASTVGLVK